MKSSRARTDTGQIAADLIAELATLRPVAMGSQDPAVHEAWAGVETFCALALRVFAKTNPSKIRSEAITLEIASLIPPSFDRVPK